MSKSKEKIIETDFDGNFLKCPHCNFITGKRSKAIMHIFNEHRNLRKRCPICGYKTKNMDDVMNHHSTYHKDITATYLFTNIRHTDYERKIETIIPEIIE